MEALTATDRGLACVFAKAPRPGHVKTRLIPAAGARGAADLARAFLSDTLRTVEAVPWLDAVVAGTGSLDALGAEVPVWDQGPGALGARLERVLRRALAEAPYAVALGADAPGLPVRLFEDMRRRLARVDVVFGPADDGGFTFVALRRCPPGLFADLPWSAADTLARAVERVRACGLTVDLVEPWFDVDEPEDLERLRRGIEAGEILAPATGALLAAPRVSVIVPVRNEARRLPRLLSHLDAVPGLAEVLVVDGQSSDGGRDLASSWPGVRVLETRPGRGRQMNAGAAAAAGDVLLFLHADVLLPTDAVRHVAEVLEDEGTVAGAFRTWTVPEGEGTWLAPLLHLADLRSRYARLPYGDQAIFVRAPVFHAVGGFPEIPLMEDLELSRRLWRKGRIVTARESVRVSGRRFEARPVYYTLLVNVYPLLFRLGVPPETLARFYADVR